MRRCAGSRPTACRRPHVRRVDERAGDLGHRVGARARSRRSRRRTVTAGAVIAAASASRRLARAPASRASPVLFGAQEPPSPTTAARRRAARHRRRRAEHERGDRIGDPAHAGPSSATARRRPACPARASRARRRGRGSARRRSSPARAPRARSARRGPPRRRASRSALRTSMASSPASLEAAPSTPSPTGAPARTGRARARCRRPAARSSSGSARRPCPSRRSGTPRARRGGRSARARRRRPASRAPPGTPRAARRSAPRQKASSSVVSARWVCSRTPRLRASSAASFISSGVTENGEHGASAIRTMAPGDGSWKRSIAASLAARISSRSSHTSSGGRPPSERPRSIEPRVGWKRSPIASRGLDLGLEQVAGVAREDVVVVHRGGAARAREGSQAGARRGPLRLGVDPRPDGIELDEPLEQRRLLREPARDPLVQVVVGVDEPGGGEPAAAVDADHVAVARRARGRRRRRRAAVRDHQVAVRVLRARRVHRGDRAALDDGDAHAAASMRSAASRTASRIFS